MNNYFSIRKKFYKDVLIKFKKNKLGKNYSKLKAFICLELGIICAYFSIFKIKPNTITFIFIFIVILASILLGSGNDTLVKVGVLIFFLKTLSILLTGLWQD